MKLIRSLLFTTVLIAGCGETAKTPLELARLDFSHGRFEEAIIACQKAIDQTDDVDELASIHVLCGQCYLDRSVVAQKKGRTQDAPADIQKAIEQFTRSIDIIDNSEARHQRSMAYELAGNDEAASEDSSRARELDETYRLAYINEKDDGFSNLMARIEAAERKQELAFSEESEDESAQRNRAEESRTESDDDDSQRLSGDDDDDAIRPTSAVTTLASTPRTESGLSSKAKPTTSLVDAIKKPSTRESKREKSIYDRWIASNGSSALSIKMPGRVISSPNKDDQATDDNPESSASDETGEAKDNMLPPAIPPSTWQPLLPQPTLRHSVATFDPPTTGILGPSPPQPSVYGPTQHVPTTGIVGPLPRLKTSTGLGAVNSMGNYSSTDFSPLQGLQFTGALPQNLREAAVQKRTNPLGDRLQLNATLPNALPSTNSGVPAAFLPPATQLPQGEY